MWGFNTGYVHAQIILKNPRLSKLKPVKIMALVDAGVLMLCIPKHIAVQLKLEKNNEREITTADGSKHVVPYVGPIEVQFENRNCFVGALVLGDEVLLGAVPMEDSGYLISRNVQGDWLPHLDNFTMMLFSPSMDGILNLGDKNI